MNVDFLFLLTALTLISGTIFLIDKLRWEKTRTTTQKQPLVIEYARAFFPVFLIVLLIRSFIGQIFHVPTGSLEPTVMTGDFMLVTGYNYGLRWPVANTKIIAVGKPQRGDIAVFTWPVNTRINFVKRVVGLPGDSIDYINNTFVINGVTASQKLIAYTRSSNGDSTRSWPVKIMEENLLGKRHKIYLCADKNNCPAKNVDFYHVVVPPGAYFMIGDNRDNSEDSRVWGFVPEAKLLGKARVILFNWHNLLPSWERTGTIL